MKRMVMEFVRRGVSACGLGPLVLAAVYLLSERERDLQLLTVSEVCIGIVSLSALAFVAGGLSAIYQMERLPLMLAVSIHGGILYLSYLGTYLVNDWLEAGKIPILVFTGIFVLGYLLIWAVNYCTVKRKTEQLNELLREKQQNQ